MISRGVSIAEEDKLKAASEKARQDPKVEAARAKEMREAINAALTAADPSMAPILKKLEDAREKAMKGRDSRPRREGEQPAK